MDNQLIPILSGEGNSQCMHAPLVSLCIGYVLGYDRLPYQTLSGRVRRTPQWVMCTKSDISWCNLYKFECFLTWISSATALEFPLIVSTAYSNVLSLTSLIFGESLQAYSCGGSSLPQNCRGKEIEPRRFCRLDYFS